MEYPNTPRRFHRSPPLIVYALQQCPNSCPPIHPLANARHAQRSSLVITPSEILPLSISASCSVKWGSTAEEGLVSLAVWRKFRMGGWNMFETFIPLLNRNSTFVSLNFERGWYEWELEKTRRRLVFVLVQPYFKILSPPTTDEFGQLQHTWEESSARQGSGTW